MLTKIQYEICETKIRLLQRLSCVFVINLSNSGKNCTANEVFEL